MVSSHYHRPVLCRVLLSHEKYDSGEAEGGSLEQGVAFQWVLAFCSWRPARDPDNPRFVYRAVYTDCRLFVIPPPPLPSF